MSADLEEVDLKRVSRRRIDQPDDAGRLDRLPPHSIEAEQGALGCMFLNPNECIQVCAEKLKADSFYDLRNRSLFEHLVAMHDERKPVDLITVQQRLRDAQQLDMVGGLAYLSALVDATPSSANLDFYVEILREKHTLRQMLQTCTAVIGRVHDSESDVDQLVDELERDVLAIRSSEQRVDKTSIQVLNSLISDLEQEANGIYKDVIATGIDDFDRYYRGYSVGDLVILGGRPSRGKTACMLQQAINIASKKHHVGIISLEMTHESLCRRQVSNMAAFDLNRIREATPEENGRIVRAVQIVQRLPISVCDQAGLSIRQIVSKARQWKARHNLKVLMVDYLQLAHGVSKRGQGDRRLEIGEISSGLKALAKDLGIVVIALSQLNRQVDNRGEDSKPRMSDLLESGSIEADADWITFVWGGKADEDEPNGKIPSVTITIAKNRNGRTGDIELLFDKPTGRFLPPSYIDEDSYQTHP